MEKRIKQATKQKSGNDSGENEQRLKKKKKNPMSTTQLYYKGQHKHNGYPGRRRERMGKRAYLKKNQI